VMPVMPVVPVQALASLALVNAHIAMSCALSGASSAAAPPRGTHRAAAARLSWPMMMIVDDNHGVPMLTCACSLACLFCGALTRAPPRRLRAGTARAAAATSVSRRRHASGVRSHAEASRRAAQTDVGAPAASVRVDASAMWPVARCVAAARACGARPPRRAEPNAARHAFTWALVPTPRLLRVVRRGASAAPRCARSSLLRRCRAARVWRAAGMAARRARRAPRQTD
jgi:hypothetical protein